MFILRMNHFMLLELLKSISKEADVSVDYVVHLVKITSVA